MENYCSKEKGAWVERNAKGIYFKENGQWVKGEVSRLDGRKYIFKPYPTKDQIHYVSLGDSIAAGHTINDNWNADYGEKSQYGVNGNTSTVIVRDCYTDLIYRELVGIYGDGRVSMTSFARSGDTVADLMNKLTHEEVRKALAKADLVTVCIGANDVLQPAMMNLDQYIETGDMTAIDSNVAANLAVLDDDTAETSYKRLFDKLTEINPNAKYVFTTIYNPYKYLWLETGRDGFFGPALSTIPEIKIDIDQMLGLPFELEVDISGLLKDDLLGTPPVQTLFSRVNGLCDWAEKYVEGTDDFDGLNRVLRRKVSSYKAVNPNIAVAETKAMFDLFPDKTHSTSDVDYSDLVNVEFTRIADNWNMSWWRLYGENPASFWTNLALKHLSFKNGFPSTNAWDYIEFDLIGFAADYVQQAIDKVIIPDVDPHPEHHGHKVLKRSFTNVFGLVKFYGYGGECSCGDVVLHDVEPTFTEAAKKGYLFEGWYMDVNLQEELSPNYEGFVDHKESHTLADLAEGAAIKQKTPKVTALYARLDVNA